MCELNMVVVYSSFNQSIMMQGRLCYIFLFMLVYSNRNFTASIPLGIMRVPNHLHSLGFCATISLHGHYVTRGGWLFCLLYVTTICNGTWTKIPFPVMNWWIRLMNSLIKHIEFTHVFNRAEWLNWEYSSAFMWSTLVPLDKVLYLFLESNGHQDEIYVT